MTEEDSADEGRERAAETVPESAPDANDGTDPTTGAETDEPAPATETAADDEPASAADDERTNTLESEETAERSLGTGVVTIARDRTLDTDPAGEAIVTALKKGVHEVVTREHIDTDHDRVQSIVSRMIDRDDVDLVVTAGATGVEPSDVTVEAVEPLLDKELTAFDELFTSLAYEVIGTRVVAARTLAGVAEGTPVFCFPGREEAVRLGLEEIVLPEIHHLVELAREADVPAEHDPSAERTVPDSDVVDDGSDGDETETATDAEAEGDSGGE